MFLAKLAKDAKAAVAAFILAVWLGNVLIKWFPLVGRRSTELGYGILKTTENTELQIRNTLRICNFASFASLARNICSLASFARGILKNEAYMLADSKYLRELLLRAHARIYLKQNAEKERKSETF